MTDRKWIRDALERFEGPLLIYARRLTGDAERARDVVQDTFARLCGQPRDRIQSRLAEWLYTVCRNAAIDVRRKERGMPLNELRTDARVTGNDPDPGQEVADREEGARVQDLLLELPDKQQEVLRLKFQGGLTYKEISRVTGESVGNVGWLIHVGLRKLRARMQGNVLEGKVRS